jgi:hypothetical protein
MAEISSFVAERCLLNLKQANQAKQPFIYLAGYRRANLALPPGFLKLWRLDRKAAEAVLLHEIAHYRRGDTLLVGTGSLLEAVIKFSAVYYLILFALPFLIINLYEWSEAQASIAFWPFVRSNLLIACGYFLSYLSSLIILLAAIWDAEFDADIVVLREQGTHEHLYRGLALKKTKWLTWFFQRLSHPPARLRRWLISLPQPLQPTFLLLFFPLAYFMRLLALHLRAVVTSLSSGLPLADLDFWGNTQAFLLATQRLWLLAGFLLALWPLLVRLWEALFLRRLASRPRYQVIYIAIGLLVALPGFVTFTWS